MLAGALPPRSVRPPAGLPSASAALIAELRCGGLRGLSPSVLGRHIICGTAVTLALTGLTGLLARQAFGSAGAGLSIPTLPAVPVPFLATIPVVGKALFSHSILTYAAFLVVPAVWWTLFGTRIGLEVRAAGESTSAAAAAGVRVRVVRSVATLVGGAFAGLAGAALVLAQVGTFTEKMTAGRGFIAIAIVVLGRWHPVGALAGALLFGATTSPQYLFQASGSACPIRCSSPCRMSLRSWCWRGRWEEVAGRLHWASEERSAVSRLISVPRSMPAHSRWSRWCSLLHAAAAPAKSHRSGSTRWKPWASRTGGALATCHE